MGSRPDKRQEISMGMPDAADGSRVLLPELLELFASRMDSSDAVCNLRCVNKATTAAFRGRPERLTLRLSQPVPHHAFAARWGSPGSMRDLTLSRREELLCLTASSGSIPNLELAIASAGIAPGDELMGRLMEAAGGAGHMHVCRWLLERGRAVDWQHELRNRVTAAAEAGKREVCELFFASGLEWCVDTVADALRGGHTGLADWLLLRRPEGPLGLTLGRRGVQRPGQPAAQQRGGEAQRREATQQRTERVRMQAQPCQKWEQ